MNLLWTEQGDSSRGQPVQAAFLTNGLPLPPVPPCKDGRNPAADPSPGTLWTLRKVTGGVFK